MFCYKCGFEVTDGLDFCPNCGTPTNETNTVKVNKPSQD